MQRLKLYDPARKPAKWTGLVHAGQFAVFHSDLATDVEKTPEGRYLQPGEDSICLVFDSLAEAEAYCATRVEAIPNLRCDIYDHTGKSRPPPCSTASAKDWASSLPGTSAAWPPRKSSPKSAPGPP